MSVSVTVPENLLTAVTVIVEMTNCPIRLGVGVEAANAKSGGGDDPGTVTRVWVEWVSVPFTPMIVTV